MKFMNPKSLMAGAIGGAALLMSLFAGQSAEAASSIVIRDFVLTHGIYQREPVGTTDSFAASDGRGYVFARIHNEGPPTRVAFIWHYEGAEHATVNMNIGTSDGWRTWSSINLRPGHWRVKLVDSNGVVVAERAFMVDSSMKSGMPQSSSRPMNRSNGPTVSNPGYGGWTGKTDG